MTNQIHINTMYCHTLGGGRDTLGGGRGVEVVQF